MRNIAEGRIIKAVASVFFVDTEGGVKRCFARKKLKREGNLYVGDYVRISEDRDGWVIEELKPRKNVLIRPYVSNIDVCLIVISCEPEPDFILVDKIIVNCLQQRIVPILVENKIDIEQVDLTEYSSVCQILRCSAENGAGIKELASVIKGKTVCFAGQSAVGKSSIINSILDSDACEVGELTKKIKRGKNTTRKTEIYNLGGTYLVDTCGFSMLDAVDIPPEELRLYYDDMEQFRKDCRFNGCQHLNEPDCAVKPHVGKEIGQNRYERYKFIYNELTERNKIKYE